MHHAVKIGVNYFDVSPYYGRGRAETVLGKALGSYCFFCNSIVLVMLGLTLTDHVRAN